MIVNADAVLYPRDQANIMPKISAPVRRFLVNRGDHVKQGQLLAELENRDLAAAAQESRGQFAQAESNYRATTDAGVPEQVTKAQTDVAAAREGARRRARSCSRAASSCSRRARWRARLVDEAQVALRAGEEPVRHRAAAPEGAADRSASRSRSKPPRRRSRPRKGHYESAQAQVSLRGDPQPDHRRRHRSAALSGRDGRTRARRCSP